MADSGEKTEQATPKRMKEVRSKGELTSSKDFTAWFGIGAGVLTLPFVISNGADGVTRMLLEFKTIVSDPNPEVAFAMFSDGMQLVTPIIMPFFGAVIVGTIAGAILQGGIHIKSFKFHGQQFNLLKGFTRMLGTQALWEGAKALLKTAAVAAALVVVIQGLMPILMNAGGLPIANLVEAASGGVGSLVQTAVLTGLALAALDVIVVMRRNRKRTMMTKKEVMDEHKSSEGDPQVKGQRRSRQLQMSRNRMISAVATADVVMLNPTHIAVALKYEPGKAAPVVVAKGAGEIAAKIREKAAEAGIPMVQDIALARALHAACDLGQQIPVELYSAVARVLAFVMALKRRGASSGVHRYAA
jgi:flagellar biosynthetic protein FlhB